jgi:hypothetical protein
MWTHCLISESGDIGVESSETHHVHVHVHETVITKTESLPMPSFLGTTFDGGTAVTSTIGVEP